MNKMTPRAKMMAVGTKFGPKKTLKPVAGKAVKSAGKMMMKKVLKKR